MSRKKNLRRVSVLVTPQTLYNLERLADMAGYGHVGKVIDKLTRDHMLALSRAARLPAKPQEVPVTGREPEAQETVLEFLRRGRKGFYPSAIRTCEGDLFLICDALEDYADICEQYIERERDKLTAYQVGAIECRIERYRYIAGKYAAAIGYDREKALARCAKRRAAEGREDVGEEALSALVRYGTENGKKNRRKA